MTFIGISSIFLILLVIAIVGCLIAKKRGMSKGIIIIVLFLIIGCAAAGYAIFEIDGSPGEEDVSYEALDGMYNITAEDMSKNETITSWISSCEKSEKEAHILLSKTEDTALLYLKNSDKLLGSYMNLHYYEEKCEADIYVQESKYEDTFGYKFFLYNLDVKNDTKVTVYVNEKKCDAEVTFTDEDISENTWRVSK